MALFTTIFLYFTLMVLLFTFSESKEIVVGGKQNAWQIPSSSSDESLNKWASRMRFTIGDSLVWKYDGNVDSVLQVSKEDYESCNKSKPIQEYKDGNTKIELKQSGPYYFISGADGHCEKGEKLNVVVLSSAHKPKVNDSPAPAPAVHVAQSTSPAPAPANGGGLGLRGGVGGVVLGLGSLVGLVMM